MIPVTDAIGYFLRLILINQSAALFPAGPAISATHYSAANNEPLTIQKLIIL